MASLLRYQVFGNVPGLGLTFSAESACLGTDVRELARIEEAHGLLPGDVVRLEGTWWARGLDDWTVLTLPEDPRFSFGDRVWSSSMAAELAESAARHLQSTQKVRDRARKKTTHRPRKP